jgi:ATP-dependent helicase/nuclease subunit B
LTAVEAALAGATVLTSSKRLSRALTQLIQRTRRAQGHSVWRTPPVLPFDAYVRKCFEDWLYSGRASASPSLLNAVQEEVLWEQIILAADGNRLLQPYATARAAKDAWDLAAAWRVPLTRASFAISEDCEAFLGWAERYREKCRAESWLDSARLTDFVRERIASGEIDVPPRIALAGFDELTPQQRDFIDALRGTADAGAGQLGLFSAPLRTVDECAPAAFAPIPVLTPMRDAAHELGAAAEWAREILLRNPRARIGVIVPKLASLRAQVDRIFGDILHPGAFPDGDAAYHISAVRPLAQYPVIHAALLLIEAGLPTIPVSTAGLLLRSPFLKGSDTERDARAMADLRLPRHPAPELTVAQLREYTPNCPLLDECLRTVDEKLAALASQQPPSAWSRTFARLLSALGWPGDRAPDSAEFQTMKAWNSALSTLATIDSIAPRADYHEALLRLRRIASNTTFQPENEGAPVQILGTLEAAGLTFDHLWIAGLDEESMPPAARPNPFLPLPLQLRRGMPHSSARRELDFARRTLSRLIASAPDVMLSYARTNGERELNPSPLLADIGAIDTSSLETIAPLRRWFQPAAFDEIADPSGPPLESTTLQRGGASLLKKMAECPFKAFAAYRLNAGELEEAGFGLSASDRGKTVHKAMELLWNELRSHGALQSSTPQALLELVERCAAQAASGDSAMAAIERERLRNVILRWLGEVESNRRPFTVVACEKRDNVVIGDLSLEVRVDRIDQLADGRLAIIDYKTGEIAKGCWEGDRPAEPQLPLYAATCRDALGAVLMAQVRRDEPGFRGLTDGEPLRLKEMRGSATSLPAQRDEWTRVLTALAAAFRQGVATVDPAKGACDYCRFTALCRVHDEVNENAAE